jgi:hypothetical protein
MVSRHSLPENRPLPCGAKYTAESARNTAGATRRTQPRWESLPYACCSETLRTLYRVFSPIPGGIKTCLPLVHMAEFWREALSSNPNSNTMAVRGHSCVETLLCACKVICHVHMFAVCFVGSLPCSIWRRVSIFLSYGPNTLPYVCVSIWPWQ